MFTNRNVPIGAVGDVNGHIVDDAYNNTNTSGYINRQRIAQRRKELEQERFNDKTGEGRYKDSPPPDYFN